MFLLIVNVIIVLAVSLFAALAYGEGDLLNSFSGFFGTLFSLTLFSVGLWVAYGLWWLIDVGVSAHP